jgi:tripartite-type tricarboxylate transporter receptor subunit TctC
MKLCSKLALLVSLLAYADAAVPAEQYPDPAKHITFVVPFSAGGSNDILSRAIGQKLSGAWQLSPAPAARSVQPVPPRQLRTAIRS